MTQKEILLEQFASLYKITGWFVNVNDAVSGLTPEQAVWTSGSENHSVWQIVHHIIFWNERWLNKFKGLEVDKMTGDNKSTFRTESTKENWDETIAHMNKSMDNWYETIKAKDEAELEKIVVEGEADNWYSYLYTIAMHTAYHIGQIVTLRKVQGSWDPDQGVAT